MVNKDRDWKDAEGRRLNRKGDGRGFGSTAGGGGGDHTM